jgi:beta-glucosidase
VDAVLLGFLPGPLAGDAMVDLLTGRVNPSAKLPITYPKYEDGGGIPYLHAVSDMCTKDTDGTTLPHWGNAPCQVQWPFGHGLSYTHFEYDNLTLNTQTLQYHQRQKSEEEETTPSLTITVTVKNAGVMAGADTVLFFTFDETRSTTPEYKRLRGFEKVWLEAGTSTQVSLTIPLDDFRFVGPHDETHYILQDDLSFRVGIGADTDCRANNAIDDDPRCSSPVTIRTDPDYVGACEAACNLWSTSGCANHFDLSMDNCWDMCSSIHQDNGTGDLEMNNDGWYVSQCLVFKKCC